MEEKQPSIIHKASKIISDFFNPLVSLFIFFVFMSIMRYSLRESVLYFLPILLMVILPVIIWLVWNVKTGRYTNMDVSNRIQRKTLYIFIAVCVVAYLTFNYFKNGYIDFVMLFILILLFALQISNYFIKSSMHTAFNVFVAALFFALHIKVGFIWLGIAVLVGVTRVILKRHTPQEVLMGAAIAFVVSFIYLYCNIQFNSEI
ncbi:MULTISPECIES: phosphatase PAP2 family protein [Chryseobacterium]|jgi:membrane-associated phospholipid phosphatase|uniref:Membrane-associated phospholipid phosphatase n=1 Tax=Chryseobacterium geocarposphaerae TaxID=1416776 RepID=A0ABU1LFW5_9FLAO|nr:MULTISPECIES: phosphatase PAP2 family protein [Chryseobacterium]ALR30224.1 ABC transporter permease [Chryseobacterium sp. IHB B 17019]MDR6405622.1 membrane-associated phospholipid phosphatase [Chryseobacterium geocarposphaerae]MDR6698853.1 membrane-associated phospholipid phosphatase [Chryseobacterium ginsenosidimutans]